MLSISAVSLAYPSFTSTADGPSYNSPTPLSADGRYVGFQSNADNVVSGDNNGDGDAFVYDRQSGVMERVSDGPDGVDGNGQSGSPTISGDGRYVAFASLADNLVSGDTNQGVDVFVRDQQTGVTERVSVGPGGIQASASPGDVLQVFDVKISRDGRYVAFTSNAHNLVSGGSPGGGYVHDRQTGTTERVVVFGRVISISADGRYVASASGGGSDIFVYDRLTETTQRVSVGPDGVQANNLSFSPFISGDGRYVVYYSFADNLVSGDTNGALDVFMYDRQTEITERVSVGSDGLQGNGDSARPTISDDGRYVVFDSVADNLVSGDTNGVRDVFWHDRQTGITQRLSVDAVGAQANAYSDSPAISPDGSYVVFESLASNLVAGDFNNDQDVFIVDQTSIAAPPDLVSWWPGDGNAKDIADGNDGTLVGGPVYATAAVDQGFLLDGMDDGINAGNAPNLQVSSGDFTVDSWVNFIELSHPPGTNNGHPAGDMSIVDKMSTNGVVNSDGWRFVKQHDNRFWFIFGAGNANGGIPTAPTTVVSTTYATTATWYHVAAVKSNTEIAIYVNGVKEASKPLPAFTDTQSADLLIGANALYGAHLNGLVDEVQIFSRALTSLEIRAIFNAGGHGQWKNQPPTDIALSNASVAENQPSGTVVGTFTTTDPDAGDTFSYTMAGGTGDADNALFTIDASGNLKTADSFDFETKSSYSIRVRSTDAGGLFTEKVFSINVTNVNEIPTNIALSNASVAENQPSGTVVGTFTTTDPDAGDTFSYTLAGGTGDADNASFAIDASGNLKTAASFDFETKSSYSIRFRSTDAGGLFTENVFSINVTNVNETPTNIVLSNASVAENQLAGTAVGDFSTTDPDSSDSFTYALVSGTGDTENASFKISGGTNTLYANATFNFEAKSSYSVRIRGTDAGGLSVEKVFTITVTNVNEAPTITAPAAQAAFEDVDQEIGGLSVGDPEGDSLAVTVAVGHGLLTLGTTTGLSVSGNGSGSVSLSGSIANLNAALASLVYRGALNFSGADTLNFSAGDGSLNTGGSVAIAVKSASQQALELQARVNALRDAGMLNSGQAKSLNIQLNLRNNNSDIGKVQNFLNLVKFYLNAGILTQSQADDLLSWGNILLLSVTRR